MKDIEKVSGLGLDLQKHEPTQSPDIDIDPVTKIGHRPTVPKTLETLVSLIGVYSSIVCPWPNFFLVATLNLANGGTAGLIVGIVVACVGMTPVYLSLAEKMRKYPTAGGQYHWVAALAPPSMQRWLGFICSFVLILTWLSFLGAAAWLFGLDISAMLLLHTGQYHVWVTFISAACIQVFACVVNITWGKHMNVPETVVLVIHTVAFFLLIGLLGRAKAMGTVTSNITFSSATGWSPGFGTLLSVLYATNSLAGFDCASHVAEDTVNPSRRLSRSLLWSTSINKVLCIIVAVMIALCAGDVNELYTGAYGSSSHPNASIIQLTYNAAGGNTALASAPFGLMAPIIVMCCVNTTAAASRMIFSLIRDDRNPFVQRFMARDLKRNEVPQLTILFTAASPMIWLWINFVSAAGYLAIVSQVTLGLATTYILVIACSLYSRFGNPDLLGRQWDGIFQLGRFWGIVVDGTALCFLLIILILSWFPFTTPIDAQEMNYAGIIVIGVAAIGAAYYVAYSRKNYRNPAPSEPGRD